MSKLKNIAKYEIDLFAVYLILRFILRIAHIYLSSIISVVLIVLHPIIVIKFHGKIITCFSGILAGIGMIIESFINVAVSSDLFIFVLVYRLYAIVFILFYIVYGYTILKGLKNDNMR